MVRLVYSNQMSELLAELAERVRAQQMRLGPLVPVRIVVSSPSVDAHARLGIARACGIAANLDVSLLTGLASDLLASEGAGARLADVPTLEAMALEILTDPAACAAPELAPVRAYLTSCGDAADAVDLRCVQLAVRVGRLFEEYTFSRGDMLAGWCTGASLGGEDAETEAWQRALWRAMFAPGGLAEKWARAGGSVVKPLHEVASTLRAGASGIPATVHVFAIAHLPRTFQQFLEKLGKVSDVVIYALTPCEGFWEDADARDPAPLVLWGRPGREQVRALNALAGFDHDDRFVDPLNTGAATLLRQLQSDVLHRRACSTPGDARPAFGVDDSLVVLEHASVRRELEAVASDIWRLIIDDETLRFDEVAVLVPQGDFATYAAQLPTVFREAHDLPNQIVGVAPPSGGVLEAVDLLLGIPHGRFTRQELLRVATHPLVAGPESGDPERWAAWTDALGIVHGADLSDHEGTYVTRDILSWDQGLRRLALGSFMAGDASGATGTFELDGQSYVPVEVPPSELREAAAFGALLRSLIEDARFARGAELTMPAWSAWMRALVESYVVVASPADEEELARCLRRVHGLADIGLSQRTVRYRVARELLRGRLASAGVGPRGEGVVVSTPNALRGLPFRAVFACGMGEGRFPSAEAEDPLDLRWTHRQAADVAPRERDRHAFLERLLTTRDRLALSYVSRDPLTGEETAPASVVQELLHALGQGYVDNPESLRRRHPLRRWDPAYFPDLFPGRVSDRGRLESLHLPEARAEASTLALREDLDAQGVRFEPAEVLLRGEGDAAWADLGRHLRLAPLPAPSADTEARIVVPLYALAKFLEFPLQAWARFRLGLDEREDDDKAIREDEPFETGLRDETLFLRGVLLDARRTGRTFEQAYDAATTARELRGSGPSGVFARAERGDHLATLETWRAHIEEQGIAVAGIEVHRFGRGGETSRADRVHEPLVLDVDYDDRAGVRRMVKAEVTGNTLPLAADLSASLTLARRREPKDPAARTDRAQLRAFVDHAVLAATGIASERPHDSLAVIATPDGVRRDHVSFLPLTRDEASGWLRGLVRELLSGPHAYFLPCEVVLKHVASSAPLCPALEEARTQLRVSDPPVLRSAYGPVQRVYQYPVPSEARAREMVDSRFGLLFTKRVSA